jgi:hypothetical protein
MAAPPAAAAVPMSRFTWLYKDSQEQNIDPQIPTCFALLDQFYASLMIPTFPLDEERDDIHDWMTNFRKQMVEQQQQQQQQQQQCQQQQQQLEGIVSTRNI